MALSDRLPLSQLVNDERYSIPLPARIAAHLESLRYLATADPSFKWDGENIITNYFPVADSYSASFSRVVLTTGTESGTGGPYARAFEVDDLISILPPILPYTIEYAASYPKGYWFSVTPTIAESGKNTVTLTTQTYFRTSAGATALGMLKSTREIYPLYPIIEVTRSISGEHASYPATSYWSGLIPLLDFVSSTVVSGANSCPTTEYDGYTAYLHAPIALDLAGPRGLAGSDWFITEAYMLSTSRRLSGNASLMGSTGLPQLAMPNLIIMDENTTIPRIKVAGDSLLNDFIEESKGKLESLNSPYGGGGTSGSAGGGGSFSDGTSGNSDSTVPEGSAESNYAKTGLFTIYAMDLGQLQTLGSKLYADDLTERIGLEVMKFLWNSPIEAAISVQSYPFSLPGGSSSSSGEQSIKFGSLVLEGVSGAPVTDSSMQIAWGSIQLNEFWGNFLDYAPHTKIDLYLPWGAGFVALDPHDCLPGALSIVTNVELAKGTCVHVVSGKYGVIGCYGGKCSTEIPLSALDTGAKFLTTTVAVAAGVAGSVAAGAGIVAGTKAAGAAQATAMRAGAGVETAIRAGRAAERVASIPYQSMSRIATSVAVPSAVAAMRTPPSIQRSGSFYSSGAGLGPQKPFVIISRPEQNVPGGYGRQFGYPSNISAALSRGSGYTEVAAIHLSGINATGKELEEIEDLLKGGVIL